MPTDGLKWGDSPAPSPSLPSGCRARRAAGDGEEHGQRLEAVRLAVEAGAYRVDSFEVADRLLELRVLEGEDL